MDEEQIVSDNTSSPLYKPAGFISKRVVDSAYFLKTSPRYKRTKNFFYDLLENNNYVYKRYFDLMMMVLIFSSVVILIREVRYASHDFLAFFNDYIISFVFLIEYLFRFWVISDSSAIIIRQYEQDELLQRRFRVGHALLKVSVAKWNYVRSPAAIIDLLAIMPFFHELRLLRLFVLFRVFKIFRYTKNMQYFGYILSHKKFELLTLLTFASVVVFVSSVLIYVMEAKNPDSAINTLFDAFYWSIVTISTVGYGDVAPVTQEGRMVAILVIISGIAVISFATSIVVTAFTEKLDDIRENKMFTDIKHLDHFYLICGYSIVAKQTASKLRRSGRDVVVLDTDYGRIKEAKENQLYGLMLDPASLSTYQSMGIDFEKQVIAVILLRESDILNVYTALTLRAMDQKTKVLSLLHEKKNRRKLHLSGVNHIVYSQELIGLLSKEYSGRPMAFETLSMLRAEDSGTAMEEIVVDERIAANFSSVGELHVRRHRLLLIGVSKLQVENFLFNPAHETPVEVGDIMIVVGEHSMINEFRLFIHKRLR
ncbi:MAG: ion transporter [Helicobacteraceae bacterium]|jgi:voltage-gated potassium channel|nr:ion transporter [Helicobacteraceae bacterium]